MPYAGHVGCGAWWLYNYILWVMLNRCSAWVEVVDFATVITGSCGNT